MATPQRKLARLGPLGTVMAQMARFDWAERLFIGSRLPRRLLDRLMFGPTELPVPPRWPPPPPRERADETGDGAPRNPQRLSGFFRHYSEGIASIAASVKAAGHGFELIHLTQPTAPESVAARIAAIGADAVGFSCMTHTAPYLEVYAPAVRRMLPRLPIVCGGVHPTLSPEACLAIEGIDAACIGEGEPVAVAIFDRLQRGDGLRGLPGLWVKTDEGIERNAPAAPAACLDTLPPPDRGVFEFA